MFQYIHPLYFCTNSVVFICVMWYCFIERRNTTMFLATKPKRGNPMKKLSGFCASIGAMVFLAMASALPAAAANELFNGGGDVYAGYTVGLGGAFNDKRGMWDGTRHTIDGGVHISEVVSIYGGVSRQNGFDCRKCPTANETKLESAIGGVMTHWKMNNVVTLNIGGGIGAYRVRTDGKRQNRRFDDGSGRVSGFSYEGRFGVNFDLNEMSGLPVSVEANLTAQRLGNGQVKGMGETGYIPGLRIIGTF